MKLIDLNAYRHQRSKYSLCCSVSREGTYPGQGVPTLAEGGGGYLPWMGVHSLDWGGGPWLGGTYPGRMAPTLDGGTYLGHRGTYQLLLG